MVIERLNRNHRWDDEDNETQSAAFKPLTREQAQALRQQNPPLSPWRVLLVQAGVGGVVALLAVLATGSQAVGWSALYGAATVVVPGALMARGATSPLSSVSPLSGALSFMMWAAVKMVFSVALLLLAPKLVQSLSWPALLAAMALCMQVYLFALLWRGRQRTNLDGTIRDGS